MSEFLRIDSFTKFVKIRSIRCKKYLSKKQNFDHLSPNIIPKIVRQFTAQKCAESLAQHCDKNPADVLHDHTRSLCLIRHQRLWANFSLDRYTKKYEARIGFQIANQCYPEMNPQHGMSVTDLKWSALGRAWLNQSRSEQLTLDRVGLHDRLQATEIYLGIGLSRPFRGKIWPLVIGVYPIPDYQVEIDYNQP